MTTSSLLTRPDAQRLFYDALCAVTQVGQYADDDSHLAVGQDTPRAQSAQRTPAVATETVAAGALAEVA